MPALPPKLQTLNGFRVVDPPNPPYQGGLIWFEVKFPQPWNRQTVFVDPLPVYQTVII